MENIHPPNEVCSCGKVITQCRCGHILPRKIIVQGCEECKKNHEIIVKTEAFEGLVPAHNQKEIAFPDCVKRCAFVKTMGVSECDSRTRK